MDNATTELVRFGCGVLAVLLMGGAAYIYHRWYELVNVLVGGLVVLAIAALGFYVVGRVVLFGLLNLAPPALFEWMEKWV